MDGLRLLEEEKQIKQMIGPFLEGWTNRLKRGTGNIDDGWIRLGGKIDAIDGMG